MGGYRAVSYGETDGADVVGDHSHSYVLFGSVSASGETLLREAVSRLKLSPRAYTRLMKVSRSIADLAGTEKISDDHILEAISYRETDLQ